jgi:hypothetical protein
VRGWTRTIAGAGMADKENASTITTSPNTIAITAANISAFFFLSIFEKNLEKNF